jgi:hypothetical protein
VANILVVRPRYELFTSIVHAWADQILGLGFDPSLGPTTSLDLSESDATRKNVENALTQSNSRLGCIVFYGHGLANELCAQPPSERPFWSRAMAKSVAAISSLRQRWTGGGSPITGISSGGGCEAALIDSHNERLLDGKLVFAIACSSAFGLGYSIARRGTGCYFGYSDEFWIHPPTEIVFRSCANYVAISMLSNSHTESSIAYIGAIQYYDKVIEELRVGPSKGLYDLGDILTQLTWDRFRLAQLGDPKWTLRPWDAI